jgi:hypothetical protein
MAHTLYKDHTIVYPSRPIGTEESEGFVPIAVVVWSDRSTGVSRVQHLKISGICASIEDAKAMAFVEAMRWVGRKFE